MCPKSKTSEKRPPCTPRQGLSLVCGCGQGRGVTGVIVVGASCLVMCQGVSCVWRALATLGHPWPPTGGAWPAVGGEQRAKAQARGGQWPRAAPSSRPRATSRGPRGAKRGEQRAERGHWWRVATQAWLRVTVVAVVAVCSQPIPADPSRCRSWPPAGRCGGMAWW